MHHISVMINNNLSQTMGFCNAMMTGFIMINILVGIIIIVLPLPSAVKIGVLFFFYFCGLMYFIEHILLYTYLKFQEIPQEMHNYGLRSWSLEEEGIHNQQAIQDYRAEKIAHRIDVLTSKTPTLVDCCCAPNFVTAKAKQSSIGALKGLVSSIFMFILGSFVVKEIRKRRMEEQQQKVANTIPTDPQVENDQTNPPQQYNSDSHLQDQNIRIQWTQNVNRQTTNKEVTQLELNFLRALANQSNLPKTNKEVINNQAFEAERVEQVMER